MRISECRSCGAAIVWTVTHNGKPMPVDAEPAEDGNIVLRPEGERIVAEYPGRKHPSLFEVPRTHYVSHFSTCPDRDEWRKA